MKNFVVFALILIGLNCTCSNSFAYGSLKVQKDYRYTTQRDRNARIKAYQEYLEQNKVFDVDHRSNKENFEKYKEDPNHRDNIKFLKFGTELKDKNYKVIGNYYLMADNKQYISQVQDNGTVMISEDVVASIATQALK